MTEHHRPLRESLRDTLTEVEIQRAWRGIQRQRTRQESLPRRQVLGWALGAALAAGLGALLLLRPLPSPAPTPVAEAPEELRTTQGEPLRLLTSAAREPRLVALSDGSQLTLQPGAEAEVLENTGRTFVTLLRRGTARYEVRPGGPRRWAVECSLATVEVVGTAFTLHRDEHRLRVEVHHGVVLVRGERVPERVRRLVAGETLEVVEKPAPEPAPEPATQPTLRPAPPPPPRREAWREAAERGEYARAYALLGASGLQRQARRAREVDTLLLLADVARHTGHPQQAAQVLRQATRHPGDARTGLAAYTLGRLELEVLARPTQAAEAFSLVLERGEPRGLLEDALARLVQAHARAGSAEPARQAAARYEALYPQGRWLKEVRRWVESP